MKIYYYSVAALVLIASCKEKKPDEFAVEGKIKNTSSKIVYLEEAAPGVQPVIVDSATIDNNGDYKVATENSQESIYILRLPGQFNPLAFVINDTRHIKLDIDAKDHKFSYSVQGSKASKELQQFINKSNVELAAIYAYNMQLDSLSKTNFPDSLATGLVAKQQTAIKNYKVYIADFINKAGSPSLALFALGNYQMYAQSPGLKLDAFSQEQVKQIIDRTAAKFPEHRALAQVKNTVNAPAETTTNSTSLLNKPAPDFTLNDVNGKPVSLSSFKGKYVLVDFWASWCGPCRRENPNVVNAYEKFRNKNFTILGVSLDKEKHNWVKAIADDGLTWTQVSDLKFWESSVVPLYGIQGIPYNVLINPEGIIIAEGLTGGALDSKLNEVLK